MLLESGLDVVRKPFNRDSFLCLATVRANSFVALVFDSNAQKLLAYTGVANRLFVGVVVVGMCAQKQKAFV